MSFESVKIIVEPATVENVGIAAYPIREFVTVKVNPGGGGATTFAALTDKATADIPTINTPLATALSLKAPLASPTFTGTVVLPITTSIGTVSSTEIGYLDNVTSSIQTQLNAKAPLASPTFTGTVTAPHVEGKATGLEIYCKAGEAITAGRAVYVTGASGTNIIIGLAKADAEATSSKTIGINVTTLALNGFGYVVTEGLMTTSILDASAALGDPIWLSPATAGQLLFGLANKPSSPNHLVYLGVVARKTGSYVTEIYVKVQNGSELDELSDVVISSPVAGNALMRGATEWTNRNLVSADISDADVATTNNTLALRDSFGNLHAADMYCEGDAAGIGYLRLHDPVLDGYTSISSADAKTYIAPHSGGNVEFYHSINGGDASLSFSNTTNEFYTFPAAGGTLLANTGNLAGLTDLSTSRTSLGLGTANSPTFGGLNVFGSALFKNATNSTTAFQIQNAAGSPIAVFNTTNRSSTFGGGALTVSTSTGNTVLYNNAQIGWTIASDSALGTNDLILTRKAAASLRLGAADATGTTAPVAQTLGVQSWASSTNPNQAGATFTIAGSQGTGSGAGGSIVFQTSAAGTAGGTTPNALADKFVITANGDCFINQNQKLYVGGTSGGGFGSYGTGAAVIYANNEGIAEFHFSTFGTTGGGMVLRADNFLGFSSSSGQLGNPDLTLKRDNPHILAQRLGTNAQTSRIYTTYASATDYARLSISAQSDRNRIASEAQTQTVKPLEQTFYTSASDPTTANITDGAFGMWKNSGTGLLKLWANDGGTMKSIVLT